MNPPNILIFMTDQQRGDTILPSSPAKTPRLDGFLKESVHFSNAYCPSPHCCPSRASFFTGLYPHEHGIWNNVHVDNALSRELNKGVRLWSEDLRDRGYDLHWTGKWHISDVENPSDRGWTEHSVVAPASFRDTKGKSEQWTLYAKQTESGLQFDREEGSLFRKGYGEDRLYGVSEDPNPDRATVDRALDVLDGLSDNENPWALYIGAVSPHDPYMVPQRFLDLYNPESIELPLSFSDTMTDKPGLYRRTGDRFAQLTEKEHKEAIRHYLALCSYADSLFGEVLDKLEERGTAENTMVIFLSDHGDYCGEHGLWYKGLPSFQSAYHIPLAIRSPRNEASRGNRVESFVSLTDLAPTILEAAHCPAREGFSGRSLIPFLKGEQLDDWRKQIHMMTNGNELYGIQRSIITEKWKYVYNGFDYDELYDRINDPHEMENLAGREEQRDLIESLMTEIWRFGREHGERAINPYVPVALAPCGPSSAFVSGEKLC